MRRKILTGLGLAGALTLALAAPAFAQDVPTVPDPGGSLRRDQAGCGSGFECLF